MERFTEPIANELKFKYGSLKHAAKRLGIVYTNLSRIANGKSHELDTHIKIRIGLGHIPDREYLMPKEDFATFQLINERKLHSL